MKPLAGLRVVDAAMILAGPFAASVLGEFGAEVVKVEQPETGDPMRQLGTEGPTGDTYWWTSDTRNKESVVLDLRTADGADGLKRLIASADVLIENYRTGTMEKWGLGYETLREINPRLIQLSVSGYGRTGPLAATAGVARIAEAFTGMTHLTGEPDGPPAMSGSSALADYICGLYGAFGILTAVEARRTTGKGQQIDLALYDGIARFLDELLPVFAATNVGRERMGGETHRSVPHNNFLAADDRWVTIACTNDRLFGRLAEVMGRLDMNADERFATNDARIAHRGEVNGIVADWARTLDAEAVVEACGVAGVPSGIVHSIGDYLEHPQVAARESTLTIDDAMGNQITVPGVVPRLLDTPGVVERLGAVLGELSIEQAIERWSD